MSVLALGIFPGRLDLSTPLNQINRKVPKLTDLQKQAAPTPAGPCCTIGTVGDEVATSIENVANASSTTSGQRTLYGFDGTHHDFPWVADGGISSTAGSGAVTGFSAYAAGVTVKASIDVIKEHGAREASARKVIQDLEMHQRLRHELALVIPNSMGTGGVAGLNDDTKDALKNILSREAQKAKVFQGLVKLSQDYQLQKNNHKLDRYTYSLPAADHRLLKHLSKQLGMNAEKWAECYSLLTVPRSLLDLVRPIHNEQFVLERLKQIRDNKKLALSDQKLIRVIQILKAYKPNINQNIFSSFRLCHHIRREQLKTSMDWIINGHDEQEPTRVFNLKQLIQSIESDAAPKEFINQFFKDIPKKILIEELNSLKGISLDSNHIQKRFEESNWKIEKIIKPLQNELNLDSSDQSSMPVYSDLKELFEAKSFVMQSSKSYFCTDAEMALKRFLKEGVLDSRSEKIIPGYLASTGITLLALGRFVPLATPVGQFVLAAYAAGNLVMSAKDLHKANQYLRVLHTQIERENGSHNIAQNQVHLLNAAPSEASSSAYEQSLLMSQNHTKNHHAQTLQDAKEHYQKMRRWAIGGVVAWSINTLGMLTMGVVNTMKWAVAFATAPLTGGMSIAAGLGADAVSGWMATGMIAATAAVGAAAFVGVPSNIKLRGRAYMSLKPPKSWEKEKQGEHKRDFIKEPFTASQIEQKISIIRAERMLIKDYRKYFFENIRKSSSNRKARRAITKQRWFARILLWGTLGAFSNSALALKFKNKVNAVKLMPLQQNTLRKQVEVLQNISQVRNADLPDVGATLIELPANFNEIDFETYVNFLNNLPIVGDIAKIFAKANTVMSNYQNSESRDETKLRVKTAQHKAQYKPDVIEFLGSGNLGSETGQEVLEIMEVLNQYGPCCDTTSDGKNLLAEIKALCTDDRSKKFMQRKLFQAVNQYLIYQHRKELKEDRATWLDLYMKHLTKPNVS